MAKQRLSLPVVLCATALLLSTSLALAGTPATRIWPPGTFPQWAPSAGLHETKSCHTGFAMCIVEEPDHCWQEYFESPDGSKTSRCYNLNGVNGW